MNNTNDTLWCWLLNNPSDIRDGHTSSFLHYLREGAQRLGKDVKPMNNDGVVFDAFGLTIKQGDGFNNNEITTSTGEAGGEVLWSLEAKPFFLMAYAEKHLRRDYPKTLTTGAVTGPLDLCTESMKAVPDMTCWEDYQAFLAPFGVNMNQAYQDCVALGLVGTPLAFGSDDDDDDDYL